MKFRAFTFALLLVLPAAATCADIVVNFEDLSLPGPNTYNNNSGGFLSQGAGFNNTFDPTFGDWSGWTYSNVNDTSSSTPDYSHQYGAITGSGVGGAGNYGIAFTSFQNQAYVNLVAGTDPVSMAVTNTTYAYDSMTQGDQFAKQFGKGDFFLLHIIGYSGLNGIGSTVGEVDFYLANYTSNASLPVNVWSLVNLSKLAGSESLGFGLTSSDNGQFGMNTPAYFAMDNLDLKVRAVPEPASACLLGLAIVCCGTRRLVRGRKASIAREQS